MQNRKSTENLADYQAKYHDRSLIARLANRQFFQTVTQLTGQISFNNLLDAGCGEGTILALLRSATRNPPDMIGLDLDAARVQLALRQAQERRVCVGDIEHLPFEDDSFDLVLSLEVLEHVGQPHAALGELHRVTRKYMLASVPNEPWWRIGNMMRLKYLKHLGNTPEHINHWSTPGFKRFVGQKFRVLELRTPFLWTFILAEKLADEGYTESSSTRMVSSP